MSKKRNYAIYQPQIRPSAGQQRSISQTPGFDWQGGVVVRTPNWLGDSLMVLPALYQLRRAMPKETKLAVVCPAALAPLWRSAGWIERVIGFDNKRVRGLAANYVRATGAGAAVTLPNSFGAALDISFKGIPIRLGRGGRGRRLLLTHALPGWTPDEREADTHQASNYFDIVERLVPINRTATCPPLKVEDPASVVADFGVDTSDHLAWLAIAPGAAYGPAKQWPLENFQAIASRWCDEVGHAVIVGTAREEGLGEAIADSVPNVVNLCGKTDLTQLMAVLSLASECVANDSGTMHLAAAVGTKGIGIFGSTNPAATGPLGADWVVMHKPTPCSPCFKRTCLKQPDHDYECLKQITPKEVWGAFEVLV